MRQSTVALWTAIAAMISAIYNCLHRKGIVQLVAEWLTDKGVLPRRRK